MSHYVPTVIDKNTALDIYSRLLEKGRIIFIIGPIDDTLACSVCAQILYLTSEGPTKDIHLYINSPGGPFTSTLAIHDIMKHVSCDIATYCIGQASCAASLLIAAGKKGKRFIMPNGRICLSDQETEITQCLPQDTRARESFENLLAEYTDQDLTRVRNDLERGCVKDAYQSRSYGLVDEIASA